MSTGRTRGHSEGRCDPPVPKISGQDVELSSMIIGPGRNNTGYEASQAILREIDGCPSLGPFDGCASSRSSDPNAGPSAADDPQDVGRKWLRNGSSSYIDLNHPEVCTQECFDSRDQVGCYHAALTVIEEARRKASARLAPGEKLIVRANNSDGLGSSWGAHISFAVSRSCYRRIFHERVHYALYLATCLASSIPLTGSGKVGSEDGPPVPYQLSSRADFFKTLMGQQTTFHRPIVNSRDEGLAGSCESRIARWHNIFFDHNLCHAAIFLKDAVTKLVLAMLEQDVLLPRVILEDPLGTVHAWSRDLTLRARARLVHGGRLGALDIQDALLQKACWFVATGRAAGIVSRPDATLRLWDDTLAKLRAFRDSGSDDDLAPLAGRCDWVLKKAILERAMARRGLHWDSPEIKWLDHEYSDLNHEEGLFWAYEGIVERLCSPGEIERFVHEPPSDTRAWLRAQLLRGDWRDIAFIDWDKIRIRSRSRPGVLYVVPLADPAGSTREQFARAAAPAAPLQVSAQPVRPAGDGPAP